MNKIIGIVGGMGPMAGVALFNSITGNTKAHNDQEHLSIMLMSLPGKIVDRTAFLEGNSDINPAYEIVEAIKKLEACGAEVIGIACNTSHSPKIHEVILEELASANSRAILLNMPEETCKTLRQDFPDVSRVGIMSTNGTYKSGIYKDLLVSMNYDVVVPDENFQRDVIHQIIYNPDFGIKSNADKITSEAKAMFYEAVGYFKERKVDAIILGCTELSLAIDSIPSGNMLLIDSLDFFAKALIREATITQIEMTYDHMYQY